MNSLRNIYKRYKVLIDQYVIYFLIGIAGAIIDIGIFSILFKVVGFGYLFSFILGKVVGMINNFILNARFNFKTNDKIFQRLLSFITIGTIGILIGMGLMYLTVERLGFDAVVCNILITFLIATVQFFVNRLISFNKK